MRPLGHTVQRLCTPASPTRLSALLPAIFTTLWPAGVHGCFSCAKRIEELLLYEPSEGAILKYRATDPWVCNYEPRYAGLQEPVNGWRVSTSSHAGSRALGRVTVQSLPENSHVLNSTLRKLTSDPALPTTENHILIPAPQQLLQLRKKTSCLPPSVFHSNQQSWSLRTRIRTALSWTWGHRAAFSRTGCSECRAQTLT